MRKQQFSWDCRSILYRAGWLVSMYKNAIPSTAYWLQTEVYFGLVLLWLKVWRMESKFIAFSTNHLQIRNATHITVISYNKECTDPVLQRTRVILVFRNDIPFNYLIELRPEKKLTDHYIVIDVTCNPMKWCSQHLKCSGYRWVIAVRKLFL